MLSNTPAESGDTQIDKPFCLCRAPTKLPGVKKIQIAVIDHAVCTTFIGKQQCITYPPPLPLYLLDGHRHYARTICLIPSLSCIKMLVTQGLADEQVNVEHTSSADVYREL